MGGSASKLACEAPDNVNTANEGVFKMAKFNGHKNWNHWNVSLWINNDEGLYRAAVFYRNHFRKAHGMGLTGAERAARAFLRSMQDQGIMQTPDGAPYSVASIRAAMVGM
jgi:hypothetical protein